MHAFFANLMAGLLLIHALFGWCWHHGHAWTACLVPGCELVKVTLCTGHGHAGKDQTDEGNRGQHQRPSPVEKCPSVCTFLPVGKTHTETLLLKAPFELGALYVLPAPVSADCLTGTWNGVTGPLEPQPPVRLHLLHQILLI